MKSICQLLFVYTLILIVGIGQVSAKTKTIVASGPDKTDTRLVGAFDELDVSSAIQVIYTVGTPTKVTVTAPQSILPYVRTDIKGGTLKCKVYADETTSFDYSNRKVVITITAPAIKDFDISGASSVEVTNAITNLPKLEIDLSGASNMTVGKVNVGNLEIDLSGASKLNIESAIAKQTDMDVSGASKIAIDKISTGKMDIEGSGASNGTISGTADYCEIDISGASSYDLSNLIFTTGSVEVSGTSSLDINKKSGIKSLESSGLSTVKKK